MSEIWCHPTSAHGWKPGWTRSPPECARNESGLVDAVTDYLNFRLNGVELASGRVVARIADFVRPDNRLHDDGILAGLGCESAG